MQQLRRRFSKRMQSSAGLLSVRIHSSSGSMRCYRRIFYSRTTIRHWKISLRPTRFYLELVRAFNTGSQKARSKLSHTHLAFSLSRRQTDREALVFALTKLHRMLLGQLSFNSSPRRQITGNFSATTSSMFLNLLRNLNKLLFPLIGSYVNPNALILTVFFITFRYSNPRTRENTTRSHHLAAGNIHVGVRRYHSVPFLSGLIYPAWMALTRRQHLQHNSTPVLHTPSLWTIGGKGLHRIDQLSRDSGQL